MEKIKSWFRKTLPVLKIIFLLSIIVIVVSELASLSKTISFEQIKTIFLEIAWWKLGLMVVIGLISVVPMIGYDLILNKLLDQKLKKRFIFETGWVINTINNIAGFGGVASIGLRSEFYGKGVESKKLVSSLSKVLFFLMSGLSIYSLLALVIVLLINDNAFITQYWIWLLGGGLYFPLVMLVTTVKKEGLLGGINLQNRLGLLLTSFLEWTGVAGSFIAIGWLMGINFHVSQVLPLFIAASVIGIVSMIPGALGSFDVMMIFGLEGIGIPKETVITWILLYRLCYYLIPFVIGIILFFKKLFANIDERYNGVPSELLTEMTHKLLVFALYFSGVMMVLLTTIPEAFTEVSWLSKLNPWRYHLLSQFPSVLLGFLLLVMGRGIASRVKRAYSLTVILLATVLVYTFLTDFSWAPMLFLLALLIVTIFSKSELYRKQFVYSWEAITKDFVLLISLFIFYVFIGVYNLPKFPHKHDHKISFFLFPSEKMWLTGLVAILVVAFFIWLLLKYLAGEKRILGTELDRVEVKRILTNYGGNTASQLVFLGDKQVYYYHNGEENTVFMQMSTYNDKCVVMGDPSGKEADFPQAIEQLINEADQWGYLPVFYEVSQETLMLLHQFGYEFIKMGEAAEVNIATFTTSGKKMKGQRTIMNKLTKEGYTFEVIEPPFSEATLADIRAVSDEWLGGRREKGFSLGFFSVPYLIEEPLAVIKSREGEIVAFANSMPTYIEGKASIDLMRHSPTKAPSGTMDFLFINLFAYLKEAGYETFDLGMAPLSNVGTSRKSFVQERIAALVYQFGSRFYSFQGLREYKSKYAHTWISGYTAYSRDSWILYVMITLQIIDNRPVDK